MISHMLVHASPAGRFMPFSPLRFQQYAADLSEAVYELRSEMLDREKLKQDFPGGLQTRVIGSDQYVTLGDKTVVVSPMASDQEIATALNLDKIDGVAAVAPKPAEPIASNITGLQSGAFEDALAQMRQQFADRQKRAVGKILNAVDAGAAKMDAAADQVAAKVDKEISAALQEFAQHTNGGPA